MSGQAATNIAWSQLIVEELVRCGVDYVVVAPGSRSTPLVMSVGANQQLKCAVCHDERGAGFNALGYARATGRPAAVVCTSGTAVANLLPAVIEAATDGQPMLVLTADRPWELHDTGANQTIDQRGIFGGYLNWEAQLPAPDAAAAAAVLSVVDHAAFRSLVPTPGPVHVNVQFREPLVANRPDPAMSGVPRWDADGAIDPLTRYASAGLAPSQELAALAAALSEAGSGLVVAGRGASRSDASAARSIQGLAAALGWPLLGDAVSGVPGTTGMQLLLGSAPGRALAKLDAVLLFGAQPTAKGVQQLIGAHPPDLYVQVSASSRRLDPTHLVSHRVHALPGATAEGLLQQVRLRQRATAPSPRGRANANPGAASSDLAAAAAAARAAAERVLRASALSEPVTAQAVASMRQRPLGMFLGSSMPLRDVDAFATPLAADTPVAANRGASGIDGSVASAVGFATGLDAPVVALIGDTAAIHDASSLAQLPSSTYGLVLVVVNNRGGGIFSLLPVAEQTDEDTFERFFAAPHSVAFGELAAAFGVEHEHPVDQPTLTAALDRAYRLAQVGTSTLIEVRTDRAANAALHAAVDDAVAVELSGRRS